VCEGLTGRALIPDATKACITRHDRTEDFDGHPVFWVYLNAFFDHLLAAAHQRNVAGILRSGLAGTGFFYFQFQIAGIAIKQITRFHFTTIRHLEPPLVV
jgi:hypothetical protein